MINLSSRIKVFEREKNKEPIIINYEKK